MKINNILLSDKSVFKLENYKFTKPDKKQRNKNVAKAFSVLIAPKSSKLKEHFIKTQKCYHQRTKPGNESYIKENFCALGSC